MLPECYRSQRKKIWVTFHLEKNQMSRLNKTRTKTNLCICNYIHIIYIHPYIHTCIWIIIYVINYRLLRLEYAYKNIFTYVYASSFWFDAYHVSANILWSSRLYTQIKLWRMASLMLWIHHCMASLMLWILLNV